jgi:hypothetical protein
MIFCKGKKYISNKSDVSLCSERRKSAKENIVRAMLANKVNLFLYDKNLMGLNIHFKEPFNQKVEYNV